MDKMLKTTLRRDAETITASAIRAVLPDAAVQRALKGVRFPGRVILVAAGKAAWQMAHAACAALETPVTQGIVITKYGHARGALPRLRIVEAGHPIPDENAFSGTRQAVERRTVYASDGSSKEAVIAYSLGDYCTTEEGGVNASLILNLEFTRDHTSGVTTLTDVGYTPIATVDFGPEAKQRYAVVNTDDAIALYESNYHDRIPEEIYQTLLSLREKLADTVFPKEDSETK